MSVGKYSNQRVKLSSHVVGGLPVLVVACTGVSSMERSDIMAGKGPTRCFFGFQPKLLRPAVFELPSAAPRLPRGRFRLICASFGFIIGLSHTAEAAAAPGPPCCYISTLQTLPAVNWRSVGVKRITAGVHTHLWISDHTMCVNNDFIRVTVWQFQVKYNE